MHVDTMDALNAFDMKMSAVKCQNKSQIKGEKGERKFWGMALAFQVMVHVEPMLGFMKFEDLGFGDECS